MHERLLRGLKSGFAGNLFFILFGITCYIYYLTFSAGSVLSTVIEIIAYIFEAFGFFFSVLAIIDINKSVRMRKWLKIGLPVYIGVELIMMVLELNSFRFRFYNPYSLPLAIIHAIFSAFICFSFLSLDSGNVKLETVITVCFGIILGGMLGNVIGIRIYFSIITNAISYTILFAAIRWMLKREIIEIDCHGDKARVSEYKSSFF